MFRRVVAAGSLLTLVLADASFAGNPPSNESRRATDSVVWKIDNLQQIGGHRVHVVGNPQVIDTGQGQAVEFDGQDDGLFLDTHPLAGAEMFTVEVVFRPDAAGLAEQRFFHMQEASSENRILFETRLPGNGQWFLDAFIHSGNSGHVLLAEQFKHPLGRWYHAAIVVDGKQMRHFVNGQQEMVTEIDYRPQSNGRTSLGVRINKVFWFKGAIRMARFTRRALQPPEFLDGGKAR